VLALVVGVPVANPAGREDLVCGAEAGDDEIIDLGGLGHVLRGEDNVSHGVVLVNELDSVGSSGQGCKRGGCEKDGVHELHIDS